VIKRRHDGGEQGRQDLLQHLIDNGKRPDNDEKMNARDILDQLSELLLAGAETTSATMCYFFMELARNPDVRKKLLDDIPALRVDDPLINGIQVRNDPQFDYLSACMQGMININERQAKGWSVLTRNRKSTNAPHCF
jgi:cytochrome P450